MRRLSAGRAIDEGNKWVGNHGARQNPSAGLGNVKEIVMRAHTRTEASVCT